MAQPFPLNPVYTAIAIAYTNQRLIADMVMPRVPVASKEFKYRKYELADGFTIPDTKVGRRSRPNEVDFTSTEATGSVVDWGLEDPVPQDDIDAARNIPNYDPLAQATMRTTDLILLDREKRVADVTFKAANYGTNNKSTLSGTTQWSDYTNSDPIKAVDDAMDAMVMRPNIMVIGRAVFSVLRKHPKVLKATYKTLADTGKATLDELRDLFEVEEILVGEGWFNTAKRGQNAAIGRVWGKHCALIYRDRMADANGGTTWGFTAQFGGRMASTFPDRNIGLKGGERVRVGEQVAEIVTANDLGYLFIDAVA